MFGLSFVNASNATAPVHPARADVACFVGFVAHRTAVVNVERRALAAALRELQWTGPDLPEDENAPLVPLDVLASATHPRGFVAWLRGLGWRPSTGTTVSSTSDSKLFAAVLRRRLPVGFVDWWETRGDLAPTSHIAALDFLTLRDLPVPIDSWDLFDACFVWNERRVDSPDRPLRCDTHLGAAVRSFFAQGGRLAYVIRLGDPWTVFAPVELRRSRLSEILAPQLPSPVDRATWRGLGHLFGLPGVSLLALPDLPDLFGLSPAPRLQQPAPEEPEVFVECAEPAEVAEPGFLRGVFAPRCDREGFATWRAFVQRVGRFLEESRHRLREIQFVAAVPLPVDALANATEPDIAERALQAANAQWLEAAQVQTAFVQLVYPWLRTVESRVLPENLIAPDGPLVGLLAQSALVRGSWQSLLQQTVPGVSDVAPILDRATIALPVGPGLATLRDRVSILGPTARGIRVLSDVTTDDDPVYRPAGVNRLVASLVRAARIAGDDFVFANNGEELWRRLRETLESVLTGLWAEGALYGASAAEAFDVRCDRSTMTQADLDAGRLVARIGFTASRPIEHIAVVLAMDDAGNVTLGSPNSTATTEAA